MGAGASDERERERERLNRAGSHRIFLCCAGPVRERRRRLGVVTRARGCPSAVPVTAMSARPCAVCAECGVRCVCVYASSCGRAVVATYQ